VWVVNNNISDTCMQCMESPGPVNSLLWQMLHLKCLAFWCCTSIFSSSNSLLQYLTGLSRNTKTLLLTTKHSHHQKEVLTQYMCSTHDWPRQKQHTDKEVYTGCYWHLLSLPLTQSALGGAATSAWQHPILLYDVTIAIKYQSTQMVMTILQ